MSEEMKEFIGLLNKLYTTASAEGVPTVVEDGRPYFDRCELVDNIEGRANKLLITEGGKCNWDNISIVRANGFRVFAGERDSFGWLTGCIQKNGDNRILVYG